jgi:uncharacterized protein
MGKYLLLIVGALVVYWIVRANLRRRRERLRAVERDRVLTDDMVRCADCGVHLPRGESLAVRGRFYCCAEHQSRHDSGS